MLIGIKSLGEYVFFTIGEQVSYRDSSAAGAGVAQQLIPAIRPQNDEIRVILNPTSIQG